MTKNDGERIVSLEVQIKGLQGDITEVKSDVKEIKTMLNEWAGVNARLKKLESAGNLWKWLSPSFSAILSAIMTFLIIQYLTSK